MKTQPAAVEPRSESRELPPLGRVVIEHVQPRVDGGRFPIKRTIGEEIRVTADVFADGHDQLVAVLKYRHLAHAPHADAARWHEVALEPFGNDSWGASFIVTELGEYEYTVEAWVDRFGSWLSALTAKADAGQDVASELLEGAELIQQTAPVRLKPPVAPVRLKPDTTYEPEPSSTGSRLLQIADVLRNDTLPQGVRIAAARERELRRLLDARADRSASTTAPPLTAIVDPVRARFGAWYEMFPRSCTSDPTRAGTLRDAESRLVELADMGFDVLYLPPIHPIGSTNRKGRNNALEVTTGDPGSPWAIGSDAGGHTAVDPALGTIDDFDRFVATARRLGIEIALDIAFQASPDHPWAREHPDWFRRRPDGSIKYAENPPKKYQDIYPFDFESEDWGALWNALRDVFLFWIAHGVKIFRVDNPHTKPLSFWEWVIADVRRVYPDAIFLAEAFTRPKIMRYLAKVGFNQSYTYFTWRNAAHELRDYLTELTRTELHDYFRPNFFANTPDILHAYLQHGGRPAFQVRLILAATLSPTYGIYSGFELCENVALRDGSEEYLNSEKYEIRPRDWHQPGNLNELIARVNHIRRDHPALQFNGDLSFHETDNPAFLWFSKAAPSHLAPSHHRDRVFVVVNTDPHWMQHGHVRVPLHDLGLAADQFYVVEDLLDDARYDWRGEWNYVKLDPAERVAHIFVIRDL